MVNSYRTDRKRLESILNTWPEFIKKQVRLVACGGTALTLLGIKESTKDVDFMVPEEDEYKDLIMGLTLIGYKQVTGYGWRSPSDNLVFDFYCGKSIFTTELLESPLDKGNSTKWKFFKNIEIFILNPYDLIISKMFRGDAVDVEDSLALIQSAPESVNLEKLLKRYQDTATYGINEEKLIKNFGYLMVGLKESSLDIKRIEEDFHQWKQKRT